MDPPYGTEGNLNISLDSDYFNFKPHNQSDDNDFYISDLFMTHLTKKEEEETNSVHDDMKENGCDSDGDLFVPKSSDQENGRNGPAMEVSIGIQKLKQRCAEYEHTILEMKNRVSQYENKYIELQSKNTELVNKNVELQNMNEELLATVAEYREKDYQYNCQLAEYEEKLSEYASKEMSHRGESESIKENYQIIQNERDTAMIKLGEKEAELTQFKSLVQKQMAEDELNLTNIKELSDSKRTLERVNKLYYKAAEDLRLKNKELCRVKREKRKLEVKHLHSGSLNVNELSSKQKRVVMSFVERLKTGNSEDFNDNDYCSEEEENVATENNFNGSVKDNNLPHRNLVKEEISSDEEIMNDYIRYNEFDPNSKIMQNCITGKTSSEDMQEIEIGPKITSNISVNSNTPSNGVVADDSINLAQIMGSMVMKVEDLDLISPLPESPFQKLPYSNSLKSKKNMCIQASNKKSADLQKDLPMSKLNEYKKNRLSHQTSQGFEPHIEKESESESLVSENLHYFGSTYREDNSLAVAYEGDMTVDVLSNPKKKYLVVVVRNREDSDLLSLENRKQTAQSCYDSYFNSKSVTKELLNSSEAKTGNSSNNPSSACNVPQPILNPLSFGEKTGQVILKNDDQEESFMFAKHSIKERSPKIIHKKNDVHVEQQNSGNQPFMSNTYGISNCKRKLTETSHLDNNNQSKPDIVKKPNCLPKQSANYYNNSNGINQSNADKENKNMLLNNINKPKHLPSEKHPHFTNCSNSSEKPSVDFEKSPDKNQFVEATNKVIEISENEPNSPVNAANLNSNIPDEIMTADESNETSNKITVSTPKHNISKSKDKFKEHFQFSISHDNYSQNSLQSGKKKLFQNYGCKFPTKSKSPDAPDNSKLFEQEIEETLEFSNLNCENNTNSNTVEEINESFVEHKKKLNNFADLSTENTFSASIDTPTSKKIKLSKKPQVSIFPKNESINAENDPSSNFTQTTSFVNNFKNLQSSVHLFNNTSANKCFGVFKNNDGSDKEINSKVNGFDSAESSKNIEKGVNGMNSKSLDINSNKNAIGLFYDKNENNLSNVNQEKKKKKKNKKKKKKPHFIKDPCTSAKSCTKKLKNSFPKKSLKNNGLLSSDLQNSLKTESSVTQLYQNCSENASYNLLEPAEINENSKSPEVSENHITHLKTNTPINSDVSVNNKNACNIPSFKDNLSVEDSDNHLKTIQANSNINSRNLISKGSLNDKDVCNSPSFSNVTTTQENKCKINKTPPKETDMEKTSHVHESILKIPNAVKDDSDVEHNEQVISSDFDKSSISKSEMENEVINKVEQKNVHKQDIDVYNRSSLSDNFEKDVASPDEVGNSVGNKVIEDLDKSENEAHKVHAENNSQDNKQTLSSNLENSSIPTAEIENSFENKLIDNSENEVHEVDTKHSSCKKTQAFSDNFQISSISAVEIENSFENKVTSVPINSQNEVHKVPATGITGKKKEANNCEISPISAAKLQNSFENKVIDKLDNSQNGAHEVLTKHNSYQSDISEDENTLVIADDVDCNMSESELNIENETEAITSVSANFPLEDKNEAILSPETKKRVKSKQKKRKKSKITSANKRSKSQSSCEEEPFCNSYTIEKALDDIKKMKMEELLTNHSKYKLLQHKLISALINPANAPNTVSALHQVLDFLSCSKLNPLISYPIRQNISVFFPPAENCIVEALLKTELKRKVHLQGLISSAIVTLYYLILDKKSIPKTGLGALCRIFTQLCKHTSKKQEPIKLTCDLIKEQHPHAPVLIAFMIGTWVELFEPTKDKDVFRVFLLSSIYFGLKKKPSTVTSTDWNACKAVFRLTAGVSLPTDVKTTAHVLITSMKEIVNDPPSEKDEWARDQVLIYAVTEGWTWTEENVIHYVIELLHNYAKDENNERAFSFLAELCADIGKLAPNDCLTVLEILSNMFMENYDFHYVKLHAARSLLKLLIFKHVSIPDVLTEYIQENATILNATNIPLYLRRRCISDSAELTENDIIT